MSDASFDERADHWQFQGEMRYSSNASREAEVAALKDRIQALADRVQKARSEGIAWAVAQLQDPGMASGYVWAARLEARAKENP